MYVPISALSLDSIPNSELSKDFDFIKICS